MGSLFRSIYISAPLRHVHRTDAAIFYFLYFSIFILSIFSFFSHFPLFPLFFFSLLFFISM
ncbi:hypothetical protein BDV09DRAFT_177297 [Aspergillus tetrazonus]